MFQKWFKIYFTFVYFTETSSTKLFAKLKCFDLRKKNAKSIIEKKSFFYSQFWKFYYSNTVCFQYRLKTAKTKTNNQIIYPKTNSNKTNRSITAFCAWVAASFTDNLKKVSKFNKHKHKHTNSNLCCVDDEATIFGTALSCCVDALAFVVDSAAFRPLLLLLLLLFVLFSFSSSSINEFCSPFAPLTLRRIDDWPTVHQINNQH